MPKRSEERVLPYTPQQLYDLVADIERYPEFLPWCRTAHVLERKGNNVTADLVIGYKAFSENFRSHVTLKPGKRIEVDYGGGPLTHLANKWEFAPAPGKSCKLSFYVDFDFRSSLLSGLMGVFFEQAFGRMVDAFEARAQELYS
ncbi:MAG: type II toxin-antitoxin system RatA family toxin [Alphaproteobacteria bacterium]|nr:type II toxin-antitoxin system RatA family toxin [Alphaproteobacteria bacterium]